MPVRQNAGCALLIVGMQNDLVHTDGFFRSRGALELSETERVAVVRSVNTLAQAMREAEWPVVHALWQLRSDHLNACYSVQWRDLGLKAAGALVKGTWGTDMIDGLTQGEDDFFLPVTSHSAFQFTNLDRVLRNCGVTACVVVGGAAPEAVEDSTRQGAAFGYHMLLPIDAIYPFSEKYLKRLANRADVTTTQEILDLIRARGAPELGPARAS